MVAVSGPPSSGTRRRRKPQAGDRSPATQDGWLLLIYRVPSEPSNNRVSVWRELKRLGALYLQQCTCIVPGFPECERGVESAINKITAFGGTYSLFRVRDVDPRE